MDKIKFSILMACWNSEKFIAEAIESVLHQEYQDWELIIINDSSTDDTLEIIEKFIKIDKRIHVYTCSHEGNPIKVRKNGLKYISGDYVQFLDSDDFIGKNFLSSCHQVIEETKADIVLNDVYSYLDESNVKQSFKGFKGNYNIELSGRDAFYYSLDWTIHGIMCVKTSILLDCYGYLENNSIDFLHADEVLSRLNFLMADKINFSKGIYFYRQNGSSITHYVDKKIENKILNLNMYLELLKIIENNNLDELCLEKCINLFVPIFFSSTRVCIKNLKARQLLKNKEFMNISQQQFREIIKNKKKISNFKYKIFLYSSLGNHTLFIWELSLISRFI